MPRSPVPLVRDWWETADRASWSEVYTEEQRAINARTPPKMQHLLMGFEIAQLQMDCGYLRRGGQ
jgi:hypothetical protein